MVKKSTEPKRSSESMQARFCLMVKLMFASCRFLLDYSMLVKSYLYGVLVTPMMRKQDADELGTPSEERKPMTKAKKSRKAKKARKRKSSSHASPGATSSSSAPASSPSARASDLQVVVPVEEVIHLDSSNDLDPASQYHKKSATDVATGIDQESVDIALQTKSKSGGASRKDEEKLKNVEPVLDVDGIESEYPGSELDYPMKNLKEFLKNLRHFSKEMSACLYIREAFSGFKESEEGRNVNLRMKKKHENLSGEKGEKIVESMRTATFTRVLILMIFQAENTNLKAHFSDPEWRKGHRFPKFDNGTVDYHWWEKNFDPDIVKTRLGIMERMTKEVESDLEYFLICQIVSCLNDYLHPSVDLKSVKEMTERKAFVVEGVDLGPAISRMMPVVPRNKKI